MMVASSVRQGQQNGRCAAPRARHCPVSLDPLNCQPTFLFRFFDLARGSQQAKEAHQSRQEYLDALQRAGKQPLNVTEPLGPGEYAFFMNAYGGTPVHIWSFSVRGR